MRLIIITIICIIIVGCNSNMSNCENNICKEITLLNKSSDSFGGKKVLSINSNETLKEICNELNSFTFSFGAKVRKNRGFIEIFCSDTKESYFFIIFSNVDGPIIRYKGKYYKNEKLVNLIISYLELNDNYKEVKDLEKPYEVIPLGK